ncbi:MAG TPA: hypothetical protein VEY30_14670 [Myxococcaceae bacterium]|nr:hypothetical protein [Myxococcaceae bacterium]
MPPDTARRLWYGVFDGARWHSLEQIAIPTGVDVHPFRASRLVVHGDTLVWAMRGTDRTKRTLAVVFTKRGGPWSHELVRADDATDVALAHSTARGALLAVVHPDPALQRDGGSVFLYAARPAWQPLGKVHPGDRESAIWPEMALSPAGGVLSWISLVEDPAGERRVARALVGDLASGQADVLTVDSTVAEVVLPLWFDRNSYLWITDHVEPGQSLRQLRIVESRAGRVEVAGAITNPYTGYFGATGLGRREVLIAGPLLESDHVVTLLVRVGVHCPPRGNEPSGAPSH